MSHPFDTLTPDLVLDAVESAGFISDARVLALNSYENRVYQVGIEDETPIVAKFYRPGRWSNDAILEEHQFPGSWQIAKFQSWRHSSATAKPCSNTPAFALRCSPAAAVARRSRATWISSTA